MSDLMLYIYMYSLFYVAFAVTVTKIEYFLLDKYMIVATCHILQALQFSSPPRQIYSRPYFVHMCIPNYFMATITPSTRPIYMPALRQLWDQKV